MMLRHRSNKRPSSRAVARAARPVSVTETLEGRCLLSAGTVPLSALPYVYMGPLVRFSRDAGTKPAHVKAHAKPQATDKPAVTAAPATASDTVSVPPVVAAQTE